MPTLGRLPRAVCGIAREGIAKLSGAGARAADARG
jgi:hypothetical protein